MVFDYSNSTLLVMATQDHPDANQLKKIINTFFIR